MRVPWPLCCVPCWFYWLAVRLPRVLAAVAYVWWRHKSGRERLALNETAVRAALYRAYPPLAHPSECYCE